MTVETQLTIAIMVVMAALIIQHLITGSLYRRIDREQGYSAQLNTEIEKLQCLLRLEREARDEGVEKQSIYARANAELESGEL